ncbi:hypothetical protein SBOR_6256 [Sclerotinia borealis F-4128]|uniref:Rhodopsin domain-containing protein n=1 Tax=Sclerotinia borealis (strain F-4128) TaxID=1432307 RepID=W9CF15_SCLBF|nr:hypothetical protein SBOR_6256 [Sclerotinia borealis F-4128]
MSLTTPIYPGINLDANEGPLLNTVSIAFISLTICTIAIRSFSRWYTEIPLGLDDLFILIAAILSIAYTAIVMHEVKTNFYGQHIGKSDPDHLRAYMKGLYALVIFYPIALSMSKLSLLGLYWRIFGVTGGRIPIHVASALNGAWGIAALVVGVFSCHPIQAFWDSTVPAKCINYPVFFTSNEAITIVYDVVVLFIPVWFIVQIKKSVGERISISCIFLLGLVVTVVSAVRLWRLAVAQRKPGFDPTFNETDAGLWAIIELNLWVLVASIPTFSPLLGKIWRDHAKRKVKSGGRIGSGTSSEYPFSKPKTTGTFFQKKSRNLDLDMESVFGFELGHLKGGQPDVERNGTAGSARTGASGGTGMSGDSEFEEGLGIRVVDVDLNMEVEVEGVRNAYGYACHRGGGGSGEKERWSAKVWDLAGIRVQKERDVRREAGIWV